MLELLDQQGDVETIFALIRQRWGDMVRAGDKTVWETFAEFGYGDWPTRSRCHPFAAYVVKYFVKHLLGVDLQRPGYATVAVQPQPPRGIASCQGAFPTPRGLLRVAWKQQGRRRAVQVECRPDGNVRCFYYHLP